MAGHGDKAALDKVVAQRQRDQHVAELKTGALPSVDSVIGAGAKLPTVDQALNAKPVPTKKQGGGGLLHGVEQGAHWAAKKTELAAHDAKAIPGGIYDMVNTEQHLLRKTIAHPLADPNDPRYGVNKGKWGTHAADLVHGMEHGTVQSFAHPLRDPFMTLLNASAAVSAAGSVGARAGAVGRAAAEGATVGDVAKAALRSPEVRPRLLRQGDAQVPLHPSGNAAFRAAQGLHDRVVQHAIDTNPEGRIAAYGTKRIGNALDETARYRQRLRDVPANALDSAAKKLGRGARVEKAALELTSVQTLPEEAAKYHLAQAEKGVNPDLNRGVAALYQKVADQKMLQLNDAGKVVVNEAAHPRLALADVRLAKVQGHGDQVLADYGVRTPEQLAERVNAPGRVRAGATYEKPTPAKNGVPSQTLLKAQARVARLQALHDRATAPAKETGGSYRMSHKSPDAESGVPLHDLASGGVYPKDIYDTAVQHHYYGTGSELDKRGFALLNRLKGKPDHQVTVYRGVPGDVHEIAPGDWVTPTKQYAADHAASEKGWHVISAKVPARELYTQGDSIHEFGWHPDPALPRTSPRAERIGGALSVAKDELATLEKAAAGRVKPTGMIGGSEARPGRGFVSYRTEEPRAPKSAAAASGGPVVGEAKAPVTSHAFTGQGLEHGKVPNNVPGQAARHYRQIIRFVNTAERRDEAIRTGSTTRRTSRDVLVKIPGEKHGDIPAAVNEVLGRKHVTVDDIHGIQAALEAYREDIVPHLRERFATDKGTPLGQAAPEGHVWVDRNVLGDLAKTAAGPRGKVARGFDNVNSAVTAATVYFKIGHVGTRVFTNAVTNIIQGSAAPREIAKSIHLWHALDDTDKLRALAAAGQHGFDAMPHEGASVASRVAGKGANFWAKRADARFRFNSIAYEARQAGFTTPAEFKGLLDRLERPNDFNMNAADHAKVDWVAKRANREGIAYDRLSETERRYLSRGIWFYGWLRGTTGFAFNTMAEHPYKSAGLGAAAEQGKQKQQLDLGELPSYEQGLLKLGAGSGPQRPLVADFSTFSPFATPADIAGAVARPGELSGFLNPALGAAANLGFGINQYGAKSKSPIKDALASLAAPTPEQQVLTAYLNRNKNQSRKMFTTTWQSALQRALIGPGLPRRLNRHAANSAAGREKAGR